MKHFVVVKDSAYTHFYEFETEQKAMKRLQDIQENINRCGWSRLKTVRYATANSLYELL